MGELAAAMNMLQGNFPTCVQQVNYPMHKGAPNPMHGKFYFVGSIPESCYDLERGKSKFYDSEQAALEAAVKGGATRIQRVDCSFYGI